MSDKIKLLYVDDEPVNLLLFKSLFGKKYNVITAESGVQGIDSLVDNSDVKIVISDMKMPAMNGIEFITKVKAQYPEIHYYLLSGYDITPEIKEAMASGLILQYFQKPFRMAEIDKTIEAILAKE